MPNDGLDWISTHWPLIQDPAQFLVRYAPAVRKYLEVLVANADDAEDVAQEFMLAVVKHRFAHETPERARRAFAKFLIEEVQRTLKTNTRVALEEELIEVGLMPYVAAYWSSMAD